MLSLLLASCAQPGRLPANLPAQLPSYWLKPVPSSSGEVVYHLVTDQTTGLLPVDMSKARAVILLRHAEKELQTPDPALSPQGRARTDFFSRWLGLQEINFEAVWSSDYRRTRDTARPIAERLELEVQLYEPRDLPALAKKLHATGLNAVVIGHSNTTPELAALLCQCEVEPMSEDDYERGFLILFVEGQRAIGKLDFKQLWTSRTSVSD